MRNSSQFFSKNKYKNDLLISQALTEDFFENLKEKFSKSKKDLSDQIDDNGHIIFQKEDLLEIAKFLLEFFSGTRGIKLTWKILKTIINIQVKSYKDDDMLNTYARFASYVYGNSHSSILPRGWRIVKSIPKVDFEDSETGLKSMLFRDRDTLNYVYAFAGTESGRDWLENFKQVAGMSPQYRKALDNAKAIRDYIKNGNIVYTGHSQGGGEAALCAHHLGAKAVTFNPAGLSLITKYRERTKISKKSEIHSYIYFTDILNLVQSLTVFLPFIPNLKADGEPHYIYNNIPLDLNIDRWHGMDGFLYYLNIEKERTDWTPNMG